MYFKQVTGKYGEDLACEYLKKLNFQDNYNITIKIFSIFLNIHYFKLEKLNSKESRLFNQ